MKHRINILLVALMICIGMQSSSAQKQNRFKNSLDKLELTEDQQLKLEALKEEQKTAFEALPSDASKEDRTTLRDSFKEKMSDILTTEQLVLWEENRKRHPKRRGYRTDGDKRNKMKGKRGEFTEEQKAKLSEARTILDAEISDEDKAVLDEIREKSKALKATFKENKETKNKESWKTIKKDMSAIHEPLKDLSKKYKEQIKAVLANLDDVKRKDSKEEGEIGNKGNRKSRHHKAKKYEHFLLLDPNTINEKEDLIQMPKVSTLSVSPNPAINQTQVNYTINSAGPVVIDVRNEQGEVIKTLLSETKEIGTYSLDADLSAFQNKSYYITITDKSGTQSERLIIVK